VTKEELNLIQFAAGQMAQARTGPSEIVWSELLDVRSSRGSLREPEVEHLHGAVRAHSDVCGLQIAVNDPLLVGGFERLGDLLRDRQCLFDRDRALAIRSESVGPSTNSMTRARTSPRSSRP